MTIPKDAGLSRLADVSNEQALTFHYPVKRRGEKRRLRPNLEAIRYLEVSSETDTEITDVQVLGTSEEWAEMNGVRALGWYGAKRSGHYPRRMFDVFELEASSSNTVAYPKPCPDCLDFSRTWACAEHPEIAWDTKRRVWVRHVNGDRTTCQCTPCHERRERAAERSSGYTDMGTDGLRPPQGLYERLIEMYGQPLPSPGFTVRQADQEAYRLANVLRRSILDALPDISVTLTGTFTLEITSDTTEASVRIEVERDGDTTP